MRKYFLKILSVAVVAVLIYTTGSLATKEKKHISTTGSQNINKSNKPTVSDKTYDSQNVGENSKTGKSVQQETYQDQPVHGVVSDKKGMLYLRGDKTKKLLALTFDDGPDKKNTPAILDVLKKYNVKATFFLIGKQIEKFPNEAKRIVAEGHEIGNHTYSHAKLDKDNKEQIRQEVIKADANISKLMGVKTKLFRPPFGIENPEILAIVGDLDYDVILWTVDTDDWRSPPVTKLINYEINHAENGAIILLHSGEGQRLEATIKSLPTVITTLQSKGYQFVTVSEIIGEQK